MPSKLERLVSCNWWELLLSIKCHYSEVLGNLGQLGRCSDCYQMSRNEKVNESICGGKTEGGKLSGDGRLIKRIYWPVYE